MAGGIAVFHGVRVGPQQARGDAAGVSQPIQRVLQFGFVTGAIHLGAVAGGDDGGLWRMGQGLTQAVQDGLDLVDGKREATPQVERCGGVIDA